MGPGRIADEDVPSWRLMTAYFDWVLRHRLVVMLICVALSLASAASLSRAFIASSVGEMFFGDAPAYHSYLEQISQFGSDEFIAVSYDDPDPLSPASLDRLQRVVRTIEAMPEIARVTSLLDVQRIRSTPDGIAVETWAEAARAQPDKRAALLEELAQDRRGASVLLARSRTRASVLCELAINPQRTGEGGPAMVEAILNAFVAQGIPRSALHRAGMPAIVAECMVLTQYSLSVIFPIVVLVMLTIVTVLFRSPLPVALSMGVSMLSVLWTLGLATAFDPKLNIFHGILPAIIAVVAVSDVIHLWSAYLHSLSRGAKKDAAIRQSAEDVGRACLLTSATTFVGFVGMIFIPTPMFRSLGWQLGFGVAMALVLAMTLVPIAASIGATPSIQAQRMDNPVARLVDRLTARCATLSTRHPRAIIALFAIATAIAGWGAAISTLETSFLRRLDPDNPVRIDAAIFEAEYAGTQSIDVFITTPQPDGLLDPAIVTGLARMEEAVEAMPGVDTALSYVDLIRTIHETMGGAGALPTTRAALAQYLLLFELGGGTELDRIIDFDRQRTRMSLRLNEQRMRATSDIAKAAESLAADALPAGVHVEATSITTLTGRWLDEIVTGQRIGLAVSFMAITILMCIGLGSIRIGVISMIPNLLPLLVLVGTCGWMWGDVDSDTIVVMMMAIGIGVDDTIHFLMRHRIESSRCVDRSEAIRNTFGFAGRAIIMTTLALALGYAPFILSDYYSTRILGTLLPYTLAVAMVADLLLVPAFIQLGWLRFPTAISPGVEENLTAG
jgi:predicted RND superfamily exporter protein